MTITVASASDLRAEIDEILPGVVADRRFLHQHPELVIALPDDPAVTE